MTVQTEENALRAHLAFAPRDLPALLKMGELKARVGDDRSATSYFKTALNVAVAATEVPQSLHPLLRNAEQFLRAVNLKFETHLLNQIAQSGAPSGGRIADAMDLLLGKRELFVQQPTSFYFPGLPQQQFYERHEFDWIADLEAAVPEMQRELQAILSEDGEFKPYVVSSPDRPSPSNPLRDDPSWGALYFWQSGTRVVANAARAPATMSALEAAPIPIIAQRSPMALYSLLKPGTHIKPHNGLLNTRLICHLPLIAPPGCKLRVGNETREWHTGEALIFDDSFEHEAWNQGSETRIVLLFEIWRPEISTDERAALTVIFEAINDYQGVPLDLG